jgi:membrane protease YdiL (CAAX protease family)
MIRGSRKKHAMNAGTLQPPNRAGTRRGIFVFLVIAFALSWLPFAPILFDRDPMGAFLMPFAPAIAAVVVRKWVTREGFGDAGLRPNLRRWPFYALAASWPILATLLSVPLALLFGIEPAGFSAPWGMEAPEALTLASWILLSIVAAPTIFGEEFGWRGYLQLRLFPGRPWRAAVATGAIWGAWHYPWLLATDQFPYHIAIALVLFTIATINASIFFGWLRLRTGDVWSASVAHGANNITEDSWHRVAFTGDRSGRPSLAGDVTMLVAEIIVLSGMVVTDSMRRRVRATANTEVVATTAAQPAGSRRA